MRQHGPGVGKAQQTASEIWDKKFYEKTDDMKILAIQSNP